MTAEGEDLSAEALVRLIDHAWHRHAPDAGRRGAQGTVLPEGTTRTLFELTVTAIIGRERVVAHVGPPDPVVTARLDSGEVTLVEQRAHHLNLYARVGDVRYQVRLAGALSTAHPIDGRGVVRFGVKDGAVVVRELPLGSRPVPGWDRAKRE